MRGITDELNSKMTANEFFRIFLNRSGLMMKKNVIVVVSVIAAVITCFFVPPDKEYLGYIQYKTIFCLLALMMLVVAIKNTKVFKILAVLVLKRVKNMRVLVTFLVFLPTILAMVITNDVAILTFVPFSIVLLQMAHKENYLPKVLILISLGCNLSPVLSPIGTAQNLFFFDYYSLSPLWFAANLWPLAVAGGGAILICCLLTKKESIQPIDTGRHALPKGKLALYFALFLVVILAIFDFVETVHIYYIAVPLVIVSLLIFDRSVFKHTKYSVIVMFIAFFILAGNLSRIEIVNKFLTGLLAGNEFFLTVGLAQLTSNTTTALLFAKFTTNHYAFITGACVSKFGSPVATMSNFMITKMYSKYDIQKTFTKKFYLAQFAFLALLFGTGLIMIFFLQPFQVRI
ncbi:MAG TPA: SLC13 family permease [Clostridia bacterium]|nr:SLC13 family permease [Clostridia bacterium]